MSTQSHSPETTAATPWLPPLYGTCSDLNPAAFRNATPARWLAEPMPADAMLSSFGDALAYATNSAAVRAGNCGLHTSTLGRKAARPMRSKSRSGSYATAFCSSGAVEIALVEPRMTV